MADIGLDDGRGLALAQFAEAPAGGAALAGGNGDRSRARQFQQGADIVGRAGRLFDEERLEWLKFAQEHLGQRRAGGAMEVDGDVDGRADGFAHGRNTGYDSFNARRIFDGAHRVGEGGGFECCKACFDALAGGLGGLLRRGTSSRSIDPNFLAY